jgi:hypothetical protein
MLLIKKNLNEIAQFDLFLRFSGTRMVQQCRIMHEEYVVDCPKKMYKNFIVKVESVTDKSAKVLPLCPCPMSKSVTSWVKLMEFCEMVRLGIMDGRCSQHSSPSFMFAVDDQRWSTVRRNHTTRVMRWLLRFGICREVSTCAFTLETTFDSFQRKELSTLVTQSPSASCYLTLSVADNMFHTFIRLQSEEVRNALLSGATVAHFESLNVLQMITFLEDVQGVARRSSETYAHLSNYKVWKGLLLNSVDPLPPRNSFKLWHRIATCVKLIAWVVAQQQTPYNVDWAKDDSTLLEVVDYARRASWLFRQKLIPDSLVEAETLSELGKELDPASSKKRQPSDIVNAYRSKMKEMKRSRFLKIKTMVAKGSESFGDFGGSHDSPMEGEWSKYVSDLQTYHEDVYEMTFTKITTTPSNRCPDSLSKCAEKVVSLTGKPRVAETIPLTGADHHKSPGKLSHSQHLSLAEKRSFVMRSCFRIWHWVQMHLKLVEDRKCSIHLEAPLETSGNSCMNSYFERRLAFYPPDDLSNFVKQHVYESQLTGHAHIQHFCEGGRDWLPTTPGLMIFNTSICTGEATWLRTILEGMSVHTFYNTSGNGGNESIDKFTPLRDDIDMALFLFFFEVQTRGIRFQDLYFVPQFQRELRLARMSPALAASGAELFDVEYAEPVILQILGQWCVLHRHNVIIVKSARSAIVMWCALMRVFHRNGDCRMHGPSSNCAVVLDDILGDLENAKQIVEWVKSLY